MNEISLVDFKMLYMEELVKLEELGYNIFGRKEILKIDGFYSFYMRTPEKDELTLTITSDGYVPKAYRVTIFAKDEAGKEVKQVLFSLFSSNEQDFHQRSESSSSFFGGFNSTSFDQDREDYSNIFRNMGDMFGGFANAGGGYSQADMDEAMKQAQGFGGQDFGEPLSDDDPLMQDPIFRKMEQDMAEAAEKINQTKTNAAYH